MRVPLKYARPVQSPYCVTWLHGDTVDAPGNRASEMWELANRTENAWWPSLLVAKYTWVLSLFESTRVSYQLTATSPEVGSTARLGSNWLLLPPELTDVGA